MSAGQLNKGGSRNPAVRPDNAQDISVSGSSASNSTAIPSGIEQLRIVCTIDCRYKIGTDSVTAGATDVLLIAGTTEIVRLNNGVDTHIAAIAEDAAETGKFNLAECG